MRVSFCGRQRAGAAAPPARLATAQLALPHDGPGEKCGLRVIWNIAGGGARRYRRTVCSMARANLARSARMALGSLSVVTGRQLEAAARGG